MEGRLLRSRLLRPQEAVSFEQRLFNAFPGSEWIFTQSGPSAGQQIDPDSVPGDPVPTSTSGPSSAIGVIGGAKFDEAELVTWLRTLPRDALLICCEPRFTKDGEPHSTSFEAHLITIAREHGVRVDVPSVRIDLYGDKAKEIQLWDVVRLTGGDIVSFGANGKLKRLQAVIKGDWAKRKATLGDRNVVEVA